jgi:adenylate cyclase
MRQHIVRILLGLAITLFFIGHAAQAYRIGFIDRVDSIIYDARLRLTLPGRGDPRVVILDIDEKSLGEVGRWPWSRNVMARLMDKLFGDYGVELVAFDVIWGERDNSSPMQALDALAREELRSVPAFGAAYQRLRDRLDYDGMFAASMKGRPVVLGFYLIDEENAVRVNSIPGPALTREQLGGRAVAFERRNGYTGNLPEYQQAAAGAGHINPHVDDDGTVRRVPLLYELDGAYYEAFSLAIVRTLLAQRDPGKRPPQVQPGFPEDGYGSMEWLKVGTLTIPVDEKVMALVPYYGDRHAFSYLSIADVLAGRARPEQLKGKVVIVGATAPGLMDLRATPVNAIYPGVEIHASLVAGMLNSEVKMKPGYVLGAEVMFLLVGGIALSLLIPMLSAVWATAAALAGAALITLFNLAVWQEGLVLPLASSLLMTAFVYTVNMAYGYFVESRAKRRLAGRFSEYVPPEVVAKMELDPDRYDKPKAAELTILFSDVRGFTGISETLSPDDLREYINTYLTEMSTVIRARHHGTLDKYIGDAIMAFWGAPVDDPGHARNGVLAALEMQSHCKTLNARFVARGWQPLRIGVGLNSGNVRVGDMGSQIRRAYTAMGDAVNVASRLEGRTKYYGVGVLVGEATRRAVGDVVFREVDRIRVKGRDEALVVYEPLGLEAEVGGDARAELGLWHETLAASRAHEWEQARANLAHLLQMSPDNEFYRRFEERLAKLPPDWDGVTSFDEK